MVKELKNKQLLLATDLDGTFLGGTDQQREALYTYVDDNRDWLGLIFVTGRDLAFIDTITANDVPRPDAIIGDVGTTVVSGSENTPVQAVEDWIDKRWPGAALADSLLSNAAHLRKQTGYGGRRVSYYYDDQTAAEISAQAIIDHGYDVIMSDGVYFDVLPRGVQKGPTLQKMIEVVGLTSDRVVVAGDTMNDRSMYETGLDGIVVANAEKPLLDAIGGYPNVFLSKEEGAGGVMEGLKRKVETLIEKDSINA